MEGTYRQIPYGITDFEIVRKENYYYVDKTRFVRKVEEAGRFLFLLRPRRFGKSLFANVLAAYYDVKMADRYDDIFRGLDIYDHPTKELLTYICEQMNEQTSNRDFNREGESFVKGYITATIGNNNLYFVCRTEAELNHGYCDILMTPKQQGHHAYIVELKYLKHSSTPAAVEKDYQDAVNQLQQYATIHPFAEQCRVQGWTLHRIVLIVRGWEMERLEEIA